MGELNLPRIIKLCLHLDLGRDRWRAVYSTVGVRSLVSAGDQPIAVPIEVIEEIRAREEKMIKIELSDKEAIDLLEAIEYYVEYAIEQDDQQIVNRGRRLDELFGRLRELYPKRR